MCSPARARKGIWRTNPHSCENDRCNMATASRQWTSAIRSISLAGGNRDRCQRGPTAGGSGRSGAINDQRLWDTSA